MLGTLLVMAILLQPPPPTPPATRPGGPGTGGGGAQPGIAHGKQPPTVDVKPETAWKDICEAYREKPLAERITVSVKVADRPAQRDNLLIRIDPGAKDRPGAVLLELGVLRVYASKDQLTAIATSNPGTYLRAPFEGDIGPRAFQKTLPPVPLPQLAAAFTDPDKVLVYLTPYASAVVWSKATLDPSPSGFDKPTVTLDGECNGARVVLTADVATGRMLRVNFAFAAIKTVMDLTITPVEPGKPSDWAIDPAARKKVDSLAELVQRPLPPPTPAAEPREAEKTPPQ